MKAKYEKAVRKALASFDRDVKEILKQLKENDKDELSMNGLMQEAAQLYERFKAVEAGRVFIEKSGFKLNQQVVREDDEELYRIYDESVPFFILEDSTKGLHAVEPKFLTVKEI